MAQTAGMRSGKKANGECGMRLEEMPRMAAEGILHAAMLAVEIAAPEAGSICKHSGPRNMPPHGLRMAEI